ncbi:MAG: diacylglycerol kinase family protein [Deltaproteobacteria bacterium]
MTRPSHTLLVANPTAQSGKNAERIEKARLLLDAAGVPHVFLATLPHGGTVHAVAEVLSTGDFDTAVYMGGDGTFAEVAKGILASGRPDHVRLAMLPTGTANDQGRSFGLSAEPDALARNVAVIAAGRGARLDVGKLQGFDDAGRLVREDYFFDSAGWGISPRILALRNEDRRTIASIPVVREVYRDQLVYAGAMLRTFVTSYAEDDGFDVEAVIDGAPRRWAGLTDLVVKGTQIYGGIWVLDPDGRPDDGRFEVVPFAHRADWLSKALVHLEHSGMFTSALESLGVVHSKGASGASIELDFLEHPGALPIRAQIDGEEFPTTARVRIDVQARTLRLIVPEQHATD